MTREIGKEALAPPECFDTHAREQEMQARAVVQAKTGRPADMREEEIRPAQRDSRALPAGGISVAVRRLLEISRQHLLAGTPKKEAVISQDSPRSTEAAPDRQSRRAESATGARPAGRPMRAAPRGPISGLEIAIARTCERGA